MSEELNQMLDRIEYQLSQRNYNGAIPYCKSVSLRNRYNDENGYYRSMSNPMTSVNNEEYRENNNYRNQILITDPYYLNSPKPNIEEKILNAQPIQSISIPPDLERSSNGGGNYANLEGFKYLEREIEPYVNNIKNDLKVELNDVKMQIKEFQNNDTNLLNIREQLSNNNNKLAKVENDLLLMNKDNMTTMTMLKTTISDTKNTNENLLKKFYELEERFNNLNGGLNEIRLTQDTMNRNIKTAENNNEQTYMKLNDMEMRLKNFTDNNNDFQMKRGSNDNYNLEQVDNNEIKEIKNNIVNLQNLVRVSKTDSSGLKENLTNLNEQVQQLLEKFNDLNQKQTNLEEQTNNINNNINKFKIKMNNYEEKLEQSDNKLNDKFTEINNLKLELKNNNKVMKDESIESLENKVIRENLDNKENIVKLENNTKELTTLKENVTGFEDKLKELENLIVDLATRVKYNNSQSINNNNIIIDNNEISQKNLSNFATKEQVGVLQLNTYKSLNDMKEAIKSKLKELNDSYKLCFDKINEDLSNNYKQQKKFNDTSSELLKKLSDEVIDNRRSIKELINNYNIFNDKIDNVQHNFNEQLILFKNEFDEFKRVQIGYNDTFNKTINNISEQINNQSKKRQNNAGNADNDEKFQELDNKIVILEKSANTLSNIINHNKSDIDNKLNQFAEWQTLYKSNIEKTFNEMKSYIDSQIKNQYNN